MRLRPLTVLAVLALLGARVAHGGAAGGPPPPPAAGAPRVEAPDSPRVAVAEFLELSRRGRYEDAARYLWLASEQVSRGADLARRLRAVLDRHLWIDVQRLSPGPEGDGTDGLPEGTDALGA